MLKFHPYFILTGDTRVEFVIYSVLVTCLFKLALQTRKIKATLEYAIVNLKPPKLYTIVVCCPSVCIHRYILTADLQSDELIIFFSPLWLS